jgi:hypothetical protein
MAWTRKLTPPIVLKDVQMSDVDAIAAMLRVAAEYELLAKRAEERLRESNIAGSS